MGIYTKLFVATMLIIGAVHAQIPSFGGCPDYPAMKNFDKEQFLGTWYEIERYFTVSEIGAKCITATYEKRPDGKIYVNNAFTNRLTGVQRIISGTMKDPKSDEGIYNIRYNALPVAYDTTLRVLETDYKNYALIWSCNAIGSLGHTESVWVMSREREPPGSILQTIYGVLDKFKISRTFFVETDQKNCETIAPAQEAIDPISDPSNELRSELNGNILAPGHTSKTVMISKETIRNFIPKVAAEEPIMTKVDETQKTEPISILKTEEPRPVMIIDAVKVEDKPLKTLPIREPVVTILAETLNTDSNTILKTHETPLIIEPTKTIEIIESIETVKTVPETKKTIETPIVEVTDIKITEGPNAIIQETKTIIETIPIQSQQTIEPVPIVQESDFKIKTDAFERETIVDAPIIATTLNEQETAPVLESTRNVEKVPVVKESTEILKDDEVKPTLKEIEKPIVIETEKPIETSKPLETILPKVVLLKTVNEIKVDKPIEVSPVPVEIVLGDKDMIRNGETDVILEVVEEKKDGEPVKVLEEIVMIVKKDGESEEMKEMLKETEEILKAIPEKTSTPIQSHQTIDASTMVDDSEPIVKTIPTAAKITETVETMQILPELQVIKTVEKTPVDSLKTIEMMPIEIVKTVEQIPVELTKIVESIPLDSTKIVETDPIESTKTIETRPIIEKIETIEIIAPKEPAQSIESIKTIVEETKTMTATPNKSMIQESIDAVEQAVRAIKEAESLKETIKDTPQQQQQQQLPAEIALVGAIKSGVTRTNYETEQLQVETTSNEHNKRLEVAQLIPVHIVSV